MTFNPNEHLIKIKTKRGLQDYLNVQSRMQWFRDLYPHGVITTTLAHLDLDRQIAVFHARVEDGQGGVGEGYGSESKTDFDDFIEKASTKAIGRALLSLGFGTCFAGDELDEEHRIVDAPVERRATDAPAPASGGTTEQYMQAAKQLKRYEVAFPSECKVASWKHNVLRKALGLNPGDPLPTISEFTADDVALVQAFVDNALEERRAS